MAAPSIADLCQAIANGEIEPALEGSDYRISREDIRKVAHAKMQRQARGDCGEPPALWLCQDEIGWEAASEMGGLA